MFTTTGGRRPVGGFSKAKLRTDQMLIEYNTPIENWRVHDLRRTCRTGMARIGIPEIVSERAKKTTPRCRRPRIPSKTNKVKQQTPAAKSQAPGC